MVGVPPFHRINVRELDSPHSIRFGGRMVGGLDWWDWDLETTHGTPPNHPSTTHPSRPSKPPIDWTLRYYGRKGGKELLAPKAPPAPTVEDVSKARSTHDQCGDRHMDRGFLGNTACPRPNPPYPPLCRDLEGRVGRRQQQDSPTRTSAVLHSRSVPCLLQALR